MKRHIVRRPDYEHTDTAGSRIPQETRRDEETAVHLTFKKDNSTRTRCKAVKLYDVIETWLALFVQWAHAAAVCRVFVSRH